MEEIAKTVGMSTVYVQLGMSKHQVGSAFYWKNIKKRQFDAF